MPSASVGQSRIAELYSEIYLNKLERQLSFVKLGPILLIRIIWGSTFARESDNSCPPLATLRWFCES